MANSSWDELGEEIKDIVNSAISTGDFTDLGLTIGGMVNDTIRAVKGSVQESFRTPPNSAQNARNQYRAHPVQPTAPVLYNKRPPGRVAGIVGSAVGYTIMSVGLIGTGICGIISAAMHTFIIPLAVFGTLSVVGLGLGISGTSQVNYINRFRRYVQRLGSSTRIPVRVLAEKTGKSVSYTIRDLQKMIDQRLFYQGHLDAENEYLILSDKAYQDYRIAQAQQQQQQQKELELQRETSRLSPECQELIRQGQDYIQRIRKCNDAIPGQEMSQKLDKMEQLVQRIFDEVRRNPQVVSDLHKMMEYYLPTTLKLLAAYQELDAQPISGENISASKCEIETAIDTMNEAFEKLLDGLFADRAWDISSDISVLNTMLAQEGLKNKDFNIKNNA